MRLLINMSRFIDKTYNFFEFGEIHVEQRIFLGSSLCFYVVFTSLYFSNK